MRRRRPDLDEGGLAHHVEHGDAPGDGDGLVFQRLKVCQDVGGVVGDGKALNGERVAPLGAQFVQLAEAVGVNAFGSGFRRGDVGGVSLGHAGVSSLVVARESIPQRGALQVRMFVAPGRRNFRRRHDLTFNDPACFPYPNPKR